MDAYQYFPTPRALAQKMWAKFANREFVRVLEPSAGEGHLAECCPGFDERYRRTAVDCVELDISKHAALRSKGINVVGTDFLAFGSGAIYSHVIMNPPFAEGARHILKAFDVVWNAEIVCLLNADTIRTPFSAERQQLLRLIEQHGSVEIVEGAFMVDEAERKTPVDVAIVHLVKRADFSQDILGSFVDDLKADEASKESLAGDFAEQHAVALPNSVIENSVRAFNAAVKAMRESVVAQARSNYFTALLGETMAVRQAETSSADTRKPDSLAWVQEEVAKQYAELKDRAWSGILRGSQVTSRLSSNAQKRIESEFDTSIKKLEFTVPNIYGFLHGIVASQGEIQIAMLCDCFDAFSRYHAENVSYARGWKSNSKHRTCALKLKSSRFILPVSSYSHSLAWESERLLEDFDRSFALLDGKHSPEVGLAYVFRNHFDDLRRGERVSGTYFDVRFYSGASTVHFYPKRKDLVDRLNRLVGRHRQWLPPEGERVSDEFWLAYDQADKFDAAVRKEVAKNRSSRYGRDPFWYLGARDGEERDGANAVIDAAIAAVHARHGIDVDRQLEAPAESAAGQLMLLAA